MLRGTLPPALSNQWIVWGQERSRGRRGHCQEDTVIGHRGQEGQEEREARPGQVEGREGRGSCSSRRRESLSGMAGDLDKATITAVIIVPFTCLFF